MYVFQFLVIQSIFRWGKEKRRNKKKSEFEITRIKNPDASFQYYVSTAFLGVVQQLSWCQHNKT